MVSALKKKAHEDGLLCEGVAELYLRGKGFKILERRYKTPVGEIDLIGLRNNVLVFIEVKGRQSIEEALYSLTPRMRARITEAAGHYLAVNEQYNGYEMRFDLLAVTLPFSIQHLDNAWLAAS